MTLFSISVPSIISFSNLSPQYLFHRRAMRIGQKILRPHLFHLVSEWSTANASGEGKAAFMSLGRWQGMWYVLVTWKTTAVVLCSKMPPFCPGPAACVQHFCAAPHAPWRYYLSNLLFLVRMELESATKTWCKFSWFHFSTVLDFLDFLLKN